jgi:hypothetical protein
MPNAVRSAAGVLTHRTKDEDVEIETPILTVRRGSSKRPKEPENEREKAENDEAKT